MGIHCDTSEGQNTYAGKREGGGSVGREERGRRECGEGRERGRRECGEGREGVTEGGSEGVVEKTLLTHSTGVLRETDQYDHTPQTQQDAASHHGVLKPIGQQS